MVKEIALPLHSKLDGDELLPIADRRRHARFAREREDRMKVVRHQQAESAMPSQDLVIVRHCFQDALSYVRLAELVQAFRFAVDRDEEPTSA